MGGVLPFTYNWVSSTGLTYSTQVIDSLAAGAYFLTVIDKNGCKVSDQVTIIPGNSMTIKSTYTDAICFGDHNATASIYVTGGIPGYTITWSNGASGPTLQNLAAGSYTATVKDGAGCTIVTPIGIREPARLDLALLASDAICGNNNGKLEGTVLGGTAPYSYQWQPLTATTPVVSGLAPGSYTLTTTDKNGCKVSQTGAIKNTNPLAISLGPDTTICSPAQVRLSPGSYSSYRWQDGSAGPFFIVTNPGSYSVTVSDAQGCSASSSIDIVGDCGKVFFPTAFTPNGNGRNENFGPLGNVALIKHYRLRIFNRWGQLVFQTDNPFAKWDGSTGDQVIPGAYTWYADYSTALEPRARKKGTLLLLL